MKNEELIMLQSLPLDIKIAKSKIRIEEFVRAMGGEDKVYISFSGGKDSTVLLHLVRSVYPNIEAVFCDTGLEFTEIKQFVNKQENIKIIRPKMSFKQVIENYGYPVVSKEQALYIRQYRTTKSQRVRDIRWNGSVGRIGKISEKHKYLVNAPFKVSEQCCDVMKKRPFKKYEKESGRYPILGIMASESQLRRSQYLRAGGCNSFDSKRVNSRPLGFWTEQDILEYLVKFKLEYATIYGDIIKNEEGKWVTTGERRTGCVFCGFGVHMEKSPNRYQRLEKTHPQLHQYCMDKLGFKEVCEYMNIPYKNEEVENEQHSNN